MILVVSYTLDLDASSISVTGPCITGSSKVLGSRVRKHISICSATFYARTQPSASS
jgi:hypothetical protein